MGLISTAFLAMDASRRFVLVSVFLSNRSQMGDKLGFQLFLPVSVCAGVEDG